MPRCLIFTAYIRDDLKELISKERYDYIICADGGYIHAQRFGIPADLIIGDFDSAKCPENNEKNVISVPVEKDDTDTMLCVKKAIELGYDDILILGGIGGRLDHTYANIQTLAYAVKNNVNAVLRDAQNEVCLLRPGTYSFPKFNGTFSLFAYSEKVSELTVGGVYYPAENISLNPFFPLGVSNKIIGSSAEISFTEGILLVISSKEAV